MVQKVLLFARARELAGAGELDVIVSEPATVAAVRDALIERAPLLRDVLAVSAVAVNHDFADDSRAIHPGDEVAIIPPVSGG